MSEHGERYEQTKWVPGGYISIGPDGKVRADSNDLWEVRFLSSPGDRILRRWQRWETEYRELEGGEEAKRLIESEARHE